MRNNTYSTFMTITSVAVPGTARSVRAIMAAAQKSCLVLANKGSWRMSEDDLEDLFQDIVLKAVKYWKSYSPAKSKLCTWVGRIASNCYKDALGKEMKRSAVFVPLETSNEDGVEYIDPVIESSACGCETCSEAESNEALDQIWEAVDSVSGKSGDMLRLNLKEDLTTSEVADLTGCSSGVVATSLSRGRAAVRARLGDDFLREYGYVA